jgi:hypothetical protein
MDTLEALITLLNKENLISRRQVLFELKKKRKEHQIETGRPPGPVK